MTQQQYRRIWQFVAGHSEEIAGRADKDKPAPLAAMELYRNTYGEADLAANCPEEARAVMACVANALAFGSTASAKM